MSQLNIDKTDAAGGALMGVLGIATAVVSSGYSMGNIARIGPGAFPFALGIVLTLLGAGIFIGALGKAGALPRPNWRAAAAVMAALTGFALAIDHLGLIPATIICVLIARLADGRYRPLQTLCLATGLSLMCWVIFVLGLKLPLPVLEIGL